MPVGLVPLPSTRPSPPEKTEADSERKMARNKGRKLNRKGVCGCRNREGGREGERDRESEREREREQLPSILMTEAPAT